MSFRRALPALALALLAPGGLAQSGAYDPLDHDLLAFLAPDGALSREPPAAGRAALPPAPPGGASAPLDFAMGAPLPVSVHRPVRVTLVVEVAAATPGRNADGESLEVALLQEGEPVDGGADRVVLPPLLVPGEAHVVEAILAPPAALYARGESIGVRVRPLLVGLQEGALHLRLGPDASRAQFESLRAPRVQDLGLGGEGQTVFDAGRETFSPAARDAAVHVARVTHEEIVLGALRVEQGRPLYLVFVGDEPAATAEAEHERLDEEERLAAAHAIRVGAALVRAHPGVGVALRVPTDVPGLVEVRCERNCPEGGFATAIRVEAPPDPADDERSALIPPRPQRPTPTTGEAAPAADEPRDAPWPSALAAILGALALRRRTRGAS